MKKYLLILFLIPLSGITQQYDNHWVFGNDAGLDFSSGNPLPFTSNIFSVEDCASISDSAGQLQFYTNGVNVYDRQGQMMPNGDSLATLFPWQYGAEAPQSVLIIPMPGNDHEYYLFTRSDSGLSYSVIDMTLNGGLGDLSIKNQILFNSPVQRFMTAIKHGNGINWWVLVHGLGNHFMAFKVTTSGIDTAVVSSVGIIYNYAGFNSHVEMVANLQGTQLAFSSAYGIHLVDFDRCDGTFSNFQTIALTETPYSFAYSPDGTKLYYSFHYNQFPTYLWQLCFDCGGPLDSNLTEIFYDANLNYNLGQIQNGPDGKIYVSMAYWWPTDTSQSSAYNMNLSVINDPNQLGLLCDFDTATISLGGRHSLFGLPNSPYYDMPPSIDFCGDSIPSWTGDPILPYTISIFPNPVHDLLKVFIPGIYSGVSEYAIYDLTGKIRIHGLLDPGYENMINLTTLSAGMYHIIIKNAGMKSKARSFMKE